MATNTQLQSAAGSPAISAAASGIEKLAAVVKIAESFTPEEQAALAQLQSEAPGTFGRLFDKGIIGSAIANKDVTTTDYVRNEARGKMSNQRLMRIMAGAGIGLATGLGVGQAVANYIDNPPLAKALAPVVGGILGVGSGGLIGNAISKPSDSALAAIPESLKAKLDAQDNALLGKTASTVAKAAEGVKTLEKLKSILTAIKDKGAVALEAVKDKGKAVGEWAKENPVKASIGGAAGAGALGTGGYFAGKAALTPSTEDIIKSIASDPKYQALAAGLLGAGVGGATDGAASAALTGVGAAGGAYGGTELAKLLADKVDVPDSLKPALQIGSPILGALLGGGAGLAAGKALK